LNERRFYDRNPSEREALAQQHVSIVGCGSFGSALADMLVRAGLGRLTLIDPDRLAIENVGRHVLTARDVGRPKVEALADRLREIDPELRVEARYERFRDAGGLLISSVDSRVCESLVNGVSLARKLPAMYVGAYGTVRAGEIQYCVPGATPCRDCFAQFREPEEIPADQERYTDPEYDPTRLPGQTGLWGSVLAVCGIAFHVALGLAGVRGRLDMEHTVWIVNLDYDGFRPYAVTRAKVARGCAVCDESRIAGLGV
jgi:molybdopterin/thiamine biosynthesis adenylyltransferase